MLGVYCLRIILGVLAMALPSRQIFPHAWCINQDEKFNEEINKIGYSCTHYEFLGLLYELKSLEIETSEWYGFDDHTVDMQIFGQ